MTEIKDGHPIKHWSKVVGNQFLTSPKAEMLTDEGFFSLQTDGARNQRVPKEFRPKVLVHYDKSYVLAYFQRLHEALGHHYSTIETSKLEKLVGLIQRYLMESRNTRDWTKANQLLDDLCELFPDEWNEARSTMPKQESRMDEEEFRRKVARI